MEPDVGMDPAPPDPSVAEAARAMEVSTRITAVAITRSANYPFQGEWLMRALEERSNRVKLSSTKRTS